MPRGLASARFYPGGRRGGFKATALLLVYLLSAGSATASELRPVTPDSGPGAALIERLRQGGLIMMFRHADTTGMPCDRSYVIGHREGQRNLSAAGRDQARRIGAALQSLDIPISGPILAGPVFRARDTAELAFGPDAVRVVDDLTADDYAGPRLPGILEAHRRLFAEPPPPGSNRILVGHRTPAIMVLGAGIGGRALPEGAAIVLDPARKPPEVLGVLAPAPIDGAGFHAC
jgi:phosphohistidine phosphatase SixA